MKYRSQKIIKGTFANIFVPLLRMINEKNIEVRNLKYRLLTWFYSFLFSIISWIWIILFGWISVSWYFCCWFYRGYHGSERLFYDYFTVWLSFSQRKIVSFLFTQDLKLLKQLCRCLKSISKTVLWERYNKVVKINQFMYFIKYLRYKHTDWTKWKTCTNT